MNTIMLNDWPLFELYQAMRGQILAVLTDDDLRFSPGGANPPLGVLCREIGETQRSYIDSFKCFACDFAYRNPAPGLAESLALLGAWYAQLDAELKTVVAGFTDDQLQNQRVTRGPNFTPSLHTQLSIYQEALLIFYGKASVYLKALNKPMPDQVRNWIA
ncbi:MAG: hypothetical protein ABI847_03275 [Anaerolineales bacterium]